MRYRVTSKKNWCATKSFETLEEAVAWCNKQKTKLGHVVNHYGEWTEADGRRVCGLIKDYETFGNK